jgi:hypothetical protein
VGGRGKCPGAPSYHLKEGEDRQNGIGKRKNRRPKRYRKSRMAKKKREWHKKKKISSTSLWCMLLFPILILIIAITMTRMTKIENGVSC